MPLRVDPEIIYGGKPADLRLRLAVLMSFSVVIALLFLFQTSIRFTYAPLNYLAVIALAATFPISLGAVVPAIRSPWGRWPLGCLTVVIAIPAVIIGLLSLLALFMFLSDGVDASFEPQSELKAGHSVYRIYRTNGGAMTSFGIVLRKETTIVPGLMLVTRLRAYYPASEARLETLDDGRIRFTLLPQRSETRTTIGETFDFQP